MAAKVKFDEGDEIRLSAKGMRYNYRDITVDKTYTVNDTRTISLTERNVLQVQIRDDREHWWYDADSFELVPDTTAEVSQQHHYKRFKIEPLVFIRENDLAFWQGNVVKYVCRHDAKDGLKDLKKARDYLDKEIRRLEGEENWCR